MIQESDSSFLGQLLFSTALSSRGTAEHLGLNIEISESNFRAIIREYFLPSMLPKFSPGELQIENGDSPIIVRILKQDNANLSIEISNSISEVFIRFTVSRPITEKGTEFITKTEINGIEESESNLQEARRLILFVLNHIRYFIGKNEQ